jgi:hypothetical protein
MQVSIALTDLLSANPDKATTVHSEGINIRRVKSMYEYVLYSSAGVYRRVVLFEQWRHQYGGLRLGSSVA